ncbi:MAG TPA: DUF4931 domain-containing protein [Methylomusa anaerophila]|uniref:Galactose-1-phosphate uridylyltransferase n=1 Tax=Methylomusa anaerophila TaxID=1930071 RepID=A0A348ANU0_9FIRM|nr:DUF4931 domain-containing protein [Methylomusa anaerophila]BBB92738.1 hypothetical protein MAMMFC1_03434 [Methylomusa anaerophila]HML87409.1 DUF4931 domain-containing protein [Methylomusa anaerophila]
MTTEHTHLFFDVDIGRTKPENIMNRNNDCPFCDRNSLEGVLAEDGPILLLKNKYPVLVDAFQTVLIETYDCDSELSVYPKDHLYRLMRFGITAWQEMIASNKYKSVLYYKNHGPFSGGTIRHPHMQIVGLKYIDYSFNMPLNSFEGIIIDRTAGVELNLATRPKVGFYEFNILLKDLNKLNDLRDLKNIDFMADYIQATAHFLLHHFHKWCNSYNLFFYQLEGKILVKVMPRFITSPLYIGYSIPQLSCHMEKVVQEMQNLYF